MNTCYKVLSLSCLISSHLFCIVSLDRSGTKQLVKSQKKIEKQPEVTLENPHMPTMIRPSQDRKIMTHNFADKDVKEVFTEIYNTNFWLGPQSLSGQGSSIVTTEVVRAQLPVLFDTLKIKRILDAGCGDFYWMRAVDLHNRYYVGVDVVSQMIEINRKQFGDKQHHFLCLDLSADPLPEADLIMCRDVLAHLDIKKVCATLRNFKASGSTFLLATTHASGKANTSVICGHHFPYDLTQSPFNLPEPLVRIEETTAEEETLVQAKAMGLWLLRDLDLDCLEY